MSHWPHSRLGQGNVHLNVDRMTRGGNLTQQLQLEHHVPEDTIVAAVSNKTTAPHSSYYLWCSLQLQLCNLCFCSQRYSVEENITGSILWWLCKTRGRPLTCHRWLRLDKGGTEVRESTLPFVCRSSRRTETVRHQLASSSHPALSAGTQQLIGDQQRLSISLNTHSH